MDNQPAPAGTLAFRSLLLPAAASALTALGVGYAFSCGPVPGLTLLAAPLFALVGAVAGPERETRRRVWIGALSTALNVLVMYAAATLLAGESCAY
jgi:hypothetical protein